MHSTRFSAPDSHDSFAGDAAGWAETLPENGPAIACNALIAAIRFRWENLNSFQTIVHTQHQFRNGTNTGNQWDSACVAAFSSGSSQSRANRKLRARFRHLRQLLRIENGSADNRFRHVFSDSAK